MRSRTALVKSAGVPCAGIRMPYHVYQGPLGTLSILAFGLIIGTYYWRTRALGAVVVTHILADLIALA